MMMISKSPRASNTKGVVATDVLRGQGELGEDLFSEDENHGLRADDGCTPKPDELARKSSRSLKNYPY